MVERRKHKRYRMPRGTFAILRNKVKRLCNHAKMNIGEIAMILYKSQPEVMGQVTNMSYGGIAVRAETDIHSLDGDVELDLLMAEQGIYVHNIPYVAVDAETAAAGRQQPTTARRNAFHFTHLDNEQKGRLQDLLAHHIG